jgi:heptaprenyl diphosphate synthase
MPNGNSKPLIKRIALCGVMTALALVFGYIEHLVPFPIGIYGIKIGLANLVVVVMLYTINWQSALIINLARIFLSFLLFGSATSLIYSLCGGILSFLVMLLIKSIKKPSFSVVGVSICGAICHNIGQILAAIFLLDELRIGFYLPVLIAVGALTGTLIGLVALPIIKHPIFRKFKA